jgi:hypothetical protein
MEARMKKPMRRFATEGEASKRFLLASGLEGLVNPDAAVAKAGVALDPLSAPRTGNVVQARCAADYVGDGQNSGLKNQECAAHIRYPVRSLSQNPR